MSKLYIPLASQTRKQATQVNIDEENKVLKEIEQEIIMILEQFLNKKAKEIDNPIRNWGVGYTAEVINEWINLQIQAKKLTIPAVSDSFISKFQEIIYSDLSDSEIVNALHKLDNDR